MMRFSPAFVAAFVALVNADVTNNNPAMYKNRALNCYSTRSQNPSYDLAGWGDAGEGGDHTVPSSLGDGDLGVALYFGRPNDTNVASKNDLVNQHQGSCGNKYGNAPIGGEQADPAGNFFVNWMKVNNQTESNGTDLEAITAANDPGWHSQEAGACVFLGDDQDYVADYPWLNQQSGEITYAKAMEWTTGDNPQCVDITLHLKAEDSNPDQGGLIRCKLPDFLKCEIDDGEVPVLTTAAPSTSEPCEEHLTTDETETEDGPPDGPPSHAATLAAFAASAMAMLA